MAMNLTAVFKVRDQGTAMLRKLSQSMDKINSTSRTASEGISKTQKSVSQLGSTASSTSSHLGSLKGAITGLGAAVGLGTVAKSIVGVGMEFEASMSNVAAISGATGSDFATLQAKAREMGATTNKSATEAADALSYMALAGWNTQQMVDGIEPILKLSSAGNMDLALTSDLVTDSMAAMGIQVKELPGYLDMVAKASQKSNTSIEQLMNAFLISGGQFASLNVPLEESTSLLGILANRGFKGAEAGTAMNAILTNMTTTNGQSGKAMKELGLSMWDAKGKFIGLEAGLIKVKDKLSGLTQEQRNQAISMIAGKEHLKTFQALLAGLGNEYGSLKDNIANADGSLEKMYKTMTDNLKGDWDNLTSALSEAGIAIFVQFGNALRSSVQGLTKVASVIPKVTDGIINFLKSLSFIKPLLTALGTFLGVLLSIGAGSLALSALGAALSFLLSPISLIAAGITAVGLAFMTAYKKSESFRNAINGIGKAFKAIAKIFKSGYKEYGEQRNLLEEAGFSENQIKNIMSFGYALKGAFDKVSTVMKDLGTVFQKGGVEGLINVLFPSDVAKKINGVINGIKSKISGLMSAFKEGGFGGVFDKIFGEGSFDTLKTKFEEVKAYITEKITQFKPIFDQLKEAFSTAWTTVSDILTSAWDIISPILSGLWDWIQMLGDIVMIVYNNIIAPAISFLAQLFSTLWAIAQPILMALGLAWEALSAVIKWVWDNVLAPLVDFLTSSVKTAFDKLSGALSTVQGWFESLTGWISSVYDKIREFIGYIGKVKPPSWITNGISAGVSFVKGFLPGGDKGGNPKSNYHGLSNVPYDGY